MPPTLLLYLQKGDAVIHAQNTCPSRVSLRRSCSDDGGDGDGDNGGATFRVMLV